MAPKEKKAKEAPEDPGKVAREYVNPTAEGALKSMDAPMTPAYLPHEVEAAWNAWWEESGYYRGNSSPDDKRPKFSICLPPPNVTGSLHLGHALTVAVQDLLCRWQPTHQHPPAAQHPQLPAAGGSGSLAWPTRASRMEHGQPAPPRKAVIRL